MSGENKSIAGRRYIEQVWNTVFVAASWDKNDTGGNLQDDPFIAPCCLLAVPAQHQRAEPQQDSFSAVEVGFSCACSGRGLSPPGPRPARVRKRYTTKRGLTLVNAMHITASVFINDDESGLHHDYEVWLEKLPPRVPTSQSQHSRTGEDACPGRTDRTADAHLKRQIMGHQVVVAVTGAASGWAGGWMVSSRVT